ncbi:MAG: hypothetical protein R3B93_09360 [Bacteroidia bacterium]
MKSVLSNTFPDGSTEEENHESRQIEMELNEMITERGRTFPIAQSLHQG